LPLKVHQQQTLVVGFILLVDLMPFASHLALSIGFFLGIIPSVTFIFMTLKEYDDYYEDKHFFFLMVVGLFAGMMTALMYYWSILYIVGNVNSLIFLIIIIGIYEGLLIAIILSMKRFGGKFDLTYYGVVLGGCIAGMLGMFFVYVYLNNYEVNSQSILSMALMIPTLPLLYMSMGAIIGFGLFNKRFFRFSLWVIILKIVFNIFLILWLTTFWFEPPGYGWEFMSIGLGFAGFLFYYTFRDILPGALPEHLRKHKRRTKRMRKRR
jgi:hypothetical protein